MLRLIKVFYHKHSHLSDLKNIYIVGRPLTSIINTKSMFISYFSWGNWAIRMSVMVRVRPGTMKRAPILVPRTCYNLLFNVFYRSHFWPTIKSLFLTWYKLILLFGLDKCFDLKNSIYITMGVFLPKSLVFGPYGVYLEIFPPSVFLLIC